MGSNIDIDKILREIEQMSDEEIRASLLKMRSAQFDAQQITKLTPHIYSRELWFFGNEAEQEEGPFASQADAEKASKLYGKSLSEILSDDEVKELRSLYAAGRTGVFETYEHY